MAMFIECHEALTGGMKGRIHSMVADGGEPTEEVDACGPQMQATTQLPQRTVGFDRGERTAPIVESAVELDSRETAVADGIRRLTAHFGVHWTRRVICGGTDSNKRHSLA
jgi:hypothetical protein